MPKKASYLLPDELTGEIKSGLCGTYVFFGEEDYLKNVWLGRFEKSVMTAEGFELFNRFPISLSDERSGTEKLADALFASPMMQEKTLVEVRDLSVLSSKASVLDAVCEMLSSKSEDCVAILIFRSDELIFDYKTEQSSLYKKLAGVGKTVNFELLSDAKLTAWIKKLLSASSLSISDSAASLLVDMCAKRMFSILGECEKLSAIKRIKPDLTEISCDDVRQICTQSEKDEPPFAMSDAASKWNLREMLSVLAACRDRDEEPVSVVGKLGKIYSDMLKIKAATDSGVSVQAAARAIGMNEYRAGLVAKSVQNVPTEVIEKALLLTYKTDVKLKSSMTDKWVLIDTLAAQIYTPKSLRGEDA